MSMIVYFAELGNAPNHIRWLQPTTKKIRLIGKAPSGFDGATIYEYPKLPCIVMADGKENRLLQDDHDVAAFCNDMKTGGPKFIGKDIPSFNKMQAQR